MKQLSTITVIPPVSSPSPVTLPAPLSYEFQVVEHLDNDNKIIKVALQFKENQHDQYGNISVHGTWSDVPRVQLKF